MKCKLLLLLLFSLAFYSCTKEYSCENCIPTNTNPGPGPTPVHPEIASLVCGSAVFSATAIIGTPYSATCTIAYTGGNGQAYSTGATIASTGVTGLTAVLQAGTLASGNGQLVYTITGTPATLGYADFHISFDGQSCDLSLRVNYFSTIATQVVSVSAGRSDCLAVLINGNVRAWGLNTSGQLGDGTTINRHVPVTVNGLSDIAAVAAGAFHSLALGRDGKVWSWGHNGFGQLGDGTTTERHTALQIPGLTGIAAIAAGNDYSLALKNDGTVWSWGYNHYGQLGDGTFTDKLHPVQVTNLSGVIAIAAGQEHCLALKNDGTVWSWGWNFNGTLGDGSNVVSRSVPVQVTALSGITAIATNDATHSLALKNDGTVWAWGNNFHGQLGDGTYIQKTIPIQVPVLTGITAIGTGADHSFAIKNDGSLWSWGWNGVGQIGVDIGNNSHQPSPVNVSLLPGVSRITGGDFHSIAIKTDGRVWTMGDNVAGQLGDGTNTIYRYTPMIVNGLY